MVQRRLPECFAGQALTTARNDIDVEIGPCWTDPPSNWSSPWGQRVMRLTVDREVAVSQRVVNYSRTRIEIEDREAGRREGLGLVE